jgi:hypothetical protein
VAGFSLWTARGAREPGRGRRNQRAESPFPRTESPSVARVSIPSFLQNQMGARLQPGGLCRAVHPGLLSLVCLAAKVDRARGDPGSQGTNCSPCSEVFHQWNGGRAAPFYG